MSKLFRVLTVLAFALAMTAPAAAGDPVQITITGVDPSDFPTVRLVASITDAAGRPIDKVSTTDIVLSEDGRAQRSSLERVGEQQPVAVVLALDISGSMAGKPLADAKAALATLIASLGPNDSAALITFDASVHVAQPLTKDKTLVRAAIDAAAANGNTAIFDAANSAIELLAATDPQARRAIVLLTDGVDNSSHVSLAAVAQRMSTQPYPLYVVGLGTSLDNGVLKTLSSSGTGGGLYVAPTSAQLASIYTSLAQQIRVQYLLSYRSDTASAPDGTPLSVTLQYTQAGAVLGSARVTFAVPAGHGVAAAPGSSVRIPSTVKAPIDAGGSTDPVLLGLLGSASALCLLLWVSTLVESRGFALLEQSRLARYIGATVAAEPRRSLWSRIVRPAALRAAAPFGRWAPRGALEGTRRKLAQSGRAIDLTPAEFLGIRIGLGFMCAVLFAFIAVFVQPDLMLVAGAGVIGLLFGYLLPGLWL
ncbi:MAG TPA: VWA domain-containing protein, partial [Candidatus Limnocylindria bacterium]